ncbi:MAG: Rpn family recombination-promoting nuclease/putative transposase, partial [Muribaculaceae bacterium]|nr:Rpn family recombination-promoting nuclease/putative transposase [Muribaculaceae bacterium]
GFKIIFGTEGKSEEILRGFLNELMKDDTDFGNIKKISFRPSIRNRQRKGEKTIIYDVLCETESLKRYIVEMQQEKNKNFLNRAIYYISRAIVDQGATMKGEPEWKYDPLYPVVGVFLCDFYVDGLKKKLITRSGNMDIDDKTPVGNHYREYFVQMPEFNKTPADCVTKLDQWIYILKHMPTLEIIPFDIKNDKALSQLDEVSRIAALDDNRKRRYEAALRDKRDRLAAIDTAIAEGHAKGLAEGLAEGKLATAKNMMDDGISIEKISLYTGIPVHELKAQLFFHRS